jgi:hypothetical protein
MKYGSNWVPPAKLDCRFFVVYLTVSFLWDRTIIFYHMSQASPVMNAFCNCPLNPVFQGPMDVTAWLRNMQKTAAETMSKTATPAITIKYFHVFPEVPPLECCWFVGVAEKLPGDWIDSSSGFEPLESAGEGSGADGGGSFLFLFGTAGKAPLLLVVGRSMICPEDDPSPAGAAARLLECSSSLRRANLTSFCAMWTFCGSEAPALCKKQIMLWFRSIIF